MYRNTIKRLGEDGYYDWLRENWDKIRARDDKRMAKLLEQRQRQWSVERGLGNEDV
jgi:hypothetical protein